MTYPNINISVLVSANSQSLTGFLKYLPKNEALLVQELSRIFFFQNPFPAIAKQGGCDKGRSGNATKVFNFPYSK